MSAYGISKTTTAVSLLAGIATTRIAREGGGAGIQHTVLRAQCDREVCSRSNETAQCAGEGPRTRIWRGNQRIRMVTTGGTISTIAGNASIGDTVAGGPGPSAALDTPWQIRVSSGSVCVET